MDRFNRLLSQFVIYSRSHRRASCLQVKPARCGHTEMLTTYAFVILSIGLSNYLWYLVPLLLRIYYGLYGYTYKYSILHTLQ